MKKTVFVVFLILEGCATLRTPIDCGCGISSQCTTQCIEFWPRGSLMKSWIADQCHKLVESVLLNEVACISEGICDDEDRIIVFEDEDGLRHTYSSYARLYAMARVCDDLPSDELQSKELADRFRFAKKTVVSFGQSQPWVVSRGFESAAGRLSIRFGDVHSSGDHRLDPPWFGFTNIVFLCGSDGRLKSAFSTRVEPVCDHELIFAMCDQMATALAEEFCIRGRVVNTEGGKVLITGEEGDLYYRVAASCNERSNLSNLYIKVGSLGSRSQEGRAKKGD